MKKTKTVLRGLLLFVGSFLCFVMASASVSAATNIGLNISTGGNLTVNGALKFTSGAANNYILQTDALGNASWESVADVLAISSTDDVAEGLTNLYYSDALVDSYIDTLRGGANGLAELDGLGFVPMANLPAGVPDGLASLDATGKIYTSQIPSIAINETYTVADIAERDLLTPNKGDVSIVIDTGSGESRSYIWDGVSWIELLTPLDLYLSKANNLGDISDFAVARSNLGLGSGSTPTFTGLSLSGLTSGSVLFGGVGGAVEQDNANFHWDDSNNRLGIKNDTPAFTLDVNGDVKVGDTYQLFLGQKTGGDPVGVNGAMYYNDDLTKFRCYENGAWKDCDTSTGSLALSSIDSAIATHSFNNGDYKQQWDWALSSADNVGMEFGESSASVATGKPAILKASTLLGSTAMPLYVKNLGNGFSFRVDDEANDVTSFIVDEEGRVGIGTNFFDPVHPETLKVEAPFGSTSFNSISAYGDTDDYLQINIKNRNAGGSASSDVVATADNGTENDFFVDMGINSSGYNNPDYSISGPNDGYLYTSGENLILGTATLGKDIIFHTSGTLSTDEKMRITGAGNVGIATSTPGSELDVKGALRLSGSNSGYVGFAPAADAGNVTYTLPSVDGINGQSLMTDGAGALSWGSATSEWQRVGIVLSPVNAGDAISTSGDIYTSAGGTITSDGLLTSNTGLTVSGAAINLNDNSNFDTNINTGTSTGIVTIGNSASGAIELISADSINLTAANSVFSSDGVDFVLQAAGNATTANVQIGAGGLGSDTPDLLILDNKNTVADPVGTNGAMYYNSNLNKLRCYEAGAWKDCDRSNVATLQSAYNNNGTITTAAGAAIDFILANGDFTASGAGSVNLTPTGASSFTSDDALTFTAGASSTWGTSAGDLTLQVAGTGTTGSVKIGEGGAGSVTPDLLALDVKNTGGDPVGVNGEMYYNDASGKFRCYENGIWKDCDTSTASLALSSIDSATATQSFNNGDYKQQWDWALSSAGNIGMEFGENSASVATGKSAILSASTLLNSTAMPLYVKNLGDGFSFRVDDEANDTTSFVIDEAGRVGVGTDFFDPIAPETLKVEAPSGSSSYNSISAYGDVDNYLQINIRNRNAGPDASSDIVATANNGTESNYYVNMGIGSSGYNSAIYPLYGPNDGYIQTVGENLIVGTGTAGKDIIFHTGGFEVTDERVRITGDGKFGINTSAPGSELDVKGTMRLSGSNSGYVGFAPAADAGNITYSWPSSAGVDGQALITNGLGGLAWGTPSKLLQRVGTILSPFNVGDDFTTSGDIYTSAGGTIASDGLLTANLGFDASGANVNLNDNSNFDTNINTGTSTGIVTIGNSAAGAIDLVSAASVNLTAGNSVFSSDGVDFVMQASGAASTANVQIGAGGLGSATPDLLVLDLKSDGADPAGSAGAMYYNDSLAKFRCYENGAWKDCDTTGGTTTLDTAYNGGGTITTAAGVPINFLLANGDFTVSGAGSVDLTPTGASSFTSSDALTFTAGASSTWSTSSGALSISSATATTWGTAAGDLTLQVAGTGTTGSVKIGAGGVGSATPDLFTLDVKSSAGDPVGVNGAMYYNEDSDVFRCYENGGWKDCGATGSGGGTTLQQAYINGASITTGGNVDLNYILTAGDFTVSGAGAVNLTPTSASSFTSGGALTLTGGASSTWSTSAGNLNLDAAATLNLGTTNATGVSIGKTGISTTVLGTLQSGNNANAGLFKLADGSNNYISLSSPAIAGDYTLTLPVDDGTANQSLITNGSGVLSWASFLSDPMTTRGDLIYRDATNATTRLGRGTAGQFLKSDGTDIAWSGLTKADVGLSNVTDEAQIAKSIGLAKGDIIAYTASGTPVRLPLGGGNGQVLTIDTAQATGMKWSSIATNANSLDFTEFKDAMTLDANTSIQLGGRTFSIIDSGAGALSLAAGGAFTLSGGAASSLSTSSGALSITSAAATTWGTGVGNLSLQVSGALTTANVQIGSGAGSGTPDLLVLDNKNDAAADPAGANGAMYYNSNLNKFRCYENGAWKNCDKTEATVTLASAYANGGTITTAAGVPINFVLTNGNFTTSGAGAVNLTPTSASSFTSGGALTLTGGASSTWSTSAGNLTLDSAATLNLGTSTATGVSIGKTGISTTVLGTLQSGNNANAGLLKLADGSNNYISLLSPAIASDYTLTLPVDDGASNQVLSTNGSGTLSWSSVLTDPMTTRGDLIYRDATNSTVRLPAGGIGQFLKSDGTDIAWSGLTKSDVGLSNVTDEAQIAKSIGTAKGDIIAYTASGTPVRLPLGGVNGQILTVDTAQATGIKWASVATNANSLDFTEFKDAMTLDAATSIQLSGFGLSIIDSGAGSLNFATGGALTLSGGAASSLSTSSGALSITSATASTWGTTTGNLSLQAAGALTTARVQIGSGAGSDTPDLLVLDNKNTATDPVGTAGAMYYSSNFNKFRCYENGAWKDCDTSSASTTWQKTGTNISPGTAGDDLLLNSGETLTIGGGTTITNHLSATASLDFPSITARSCTNLTVTVTGAQVGDTVVATPDASGGVESVNLSWNSYVSATNTVTVRVCNITNGNVNANPNTWRADVWRH